MQSPINPFWSQIIEENPRQANLPGSSFPQSDVQIEKTNWILENLNPAISQLLSAVSNIQEAVSNQSLQIYSLSNPAYSLKYPLSIIITFENGMFYAEAIDFDIYSEGNTMKEAVENMKEVIISYYNSLRKNKKKLSKKMKSNFVILSKLIKYERQRFKEKV